MSSKHQNPAKPASDTIASGFDEKMALAETIMNEDADILRALAATREVMSRRKRALRKLAR